MSNQENDKRQNHERQSVPTGPILVELGSLRQNINPLLEPKEAAYRGIRRRANASINERMSFANEGIPDLPGFVVEVDLRARSVRLYDPLTRPEYASTRAALENYLEHPHQDPYAHVIRRKFTPLEEEYLTGLAKEQLFHWLSALWRLTEVGHAQLRSGEWPKALVDRIKADRQKDAEERLGKRDPIPELV